MTTLAKLKKALPVGAILTDEKIGESHTCQIEAPQGMIWKCSDLHCLVDSTNRPWKPNYADLLERINYGMGKCETPDCEWCALSLDAS